MKPLPHAPEAERDALAAIMSDRDACALAVQALVPEHFYGADHAALFAAIRDALLAGETAQYATLRRRGIGKDLLALATRVITGGGHAHQIESYCEEIRAAAERRAVIVAAQNAMTAAYDASTPLDAVRQKAAAVTQQIGGESKEVTGADCLDAAYDHLAHPDKRPRPKAEVADLDDLLGGGLEPGRLTLVASRPNVGKSALCGHIALNAVRAGMSVVWWSLEMAPRDLGSRWLAAEARVRLHNRSAASLQPDEAARVTKARADLTPALRDRMLVWDADHAALPRIVAGMMRCRAQGRMDLAVVDYAQLVLAKGEIREQQVASVSRELKLAAGALDVPVLCAAQLNRGAATDEPKLHHLRESGALENDADVVMLLWHEDETEQVLNVRVAKNRNGPKGHCKLRIDLPIMEFKSLAWSPATAAGG